MAFTSSQQTIDGMAPGWQITQMASVLGWWTENGISTTLMAKPDGTCTKLNENSMDGTMLTGRITDGTVLIEKKHIAHVPSWHKNRWHDTRLIDRSDGTHIELKVT